MVAIIGNGQCDVSSNLDECVCSSHGANTLGKVMNPTILAPSQGKKVGQTELFNLGMANSLGEGKP